VKMKCDRCQNEVEVFSEDGFSIGYYETGLGSNWKRFANAGEQLVCDKCMWKDERYIAVYGKRD
jgi:hypothetical protein